MISLNRFFDIGKCIFWYHKIDFVISQIIFWYHKIKFVISRNKFVISQTMGVYSKTAPHTTRRLEAKRLIRKIIIIMTFLFHFLQRKILNLQMHCLLVHLVHLDACIYFYLVFLARAWLSIHTAIIFLNNYKRPACYVILCTLSINP